MVLAGRFWPIFENSSLLLNLFELIAATKDQQLFSEIFKDLVSIPTIRISVLGILRSPERSEPLSLAIGHIFNTTKAS